MTIDETVRAAAFKHLPEFIIARRDELARDIAAAIAEEAATGDKFDEDLITNMARPDGTDDRRNLAITYGLTDDFQFVLIEPAIRAAADAYLQ